MWEDELLSAIEHRKLEEYPESVKCGSNERLFHSVSPARGNLFAWMRRIPGEAALDLFGDDGALLPALAQRFDRLAVFAEKETDEAVCKKVLAVEKERNPKPVTAYRRDSSMQAARWEKTEVVPDVCAWLFGRDNAKKLEKYRKNIRYRAVIAVRENLERNQIFDIVEGSRNLLADDGSLWLLAEAGSAELIREAAERAGYGQILCYRCDPDWVFADHIELYEKTGLFTDWIELVDGSTAGQKEGEPGSENPDGGPKHEPWDGRRIWTNRDGATNGGKRPEGAEKVLYQICASEQQAYMIFARFSNQRRERFRIITTEWMNNGEIEIFKCAAVPSGAEHIAHMTQMCDMLEKQYRHAPSAFHVNELTPTNEGLGVKFEYLPGCTLESMVLERLQAGCTEEASRLAGDLFRKIRGPVLKTRPFKVTDEFIRYFGMEPQHFSDYALGVSDIDLMLDNVIVEKKKWSFIDYEWTFDFPIPLKFIYFRTMFYFSRKFPEYAAWAEAVMRKEAGISRGEQNQFTLMEDFFQRNWILEKDSLMEIQKRFRLRELTGTCGFGRWEENAYEAKIYWAPLGEAYDESRTEVLSRICTEDGCIVHIFVPEEAVSLRFDPAQTAGILTMVGITDERGRSLEWAGCGTPIGRDQMLFTDNDPQINIPLGRKMHRIRVQYFYDGIAHPESVDLMGTPEASGAVLHRHARLKERLNALEERLR